MVHLFCCFLFSWILIPCLYFNNNFSVSFFLLFSAKDSRLFIIYSISCFEFASTSFPQSNLKRNVLESLITIIFSSMILIRYNLCRYKIHSICLTLFFNLHDLFLAFICANNIGSLINIFFGVKSLILFLLLLLVVAFYL